MNPDPVTAIANDTAVLAAKEAETVAGHRLQTLLAEQAAAREKLNSLEITTATRPQRQKLRAIDIEISYEIEEANETLASKHLDVVRAQRAVAEKCGWMLSEKAKASGATILAKISDLLAEFQELKADHESGQTARSIVIQADRELNEDTPAPPSAKFASALGEGIWAVLLRLDEEQRAHAASLPHAVMLEGETVGTAVVSAEA